MNSAELCPYLVLYIKQLMILNNAFVFLALIDNTFLMKLAQHRLTSAEQLQLGVFLRLKTTTIRATMRDCEDHVTNTFALLETWAETRKTDGPASSTGLLEELSGACRDIHRADLVDHVRCGEWEVKQL